MPNLPILFCYLLLTLVTASSVVYASPSKPVANAPLQVALSREDSVNLSKFNTCLEALSRQYQVAFLCEGIPYHPTLTAEETAKLQAVWKSDASREEIVEAVAAAYDYEPEWSGKRLCLLRKRYNLEGDLPDVSFEEIFLSLERIRKLWGTRGKEDNQAYLVTKFIGTLSSDWKDKFAARLTPVSDLPPTSQQWLESFLFTETLGSELKHLRDMYYYLSVCKEGNVIFCERDVLTEIFSQRIQTGEAKKLAFAMPVYEGNLYQYRGVAHKQTIALSEVIYDGGLAPLKPITSPMTPKQRQAFTLQTVQNDPILKRKFPRYPAVIPSWATTLGELVTSSRPKGTRPVTVDSAGNG